MQCFHKWGNFGQIIKRWCHSFLIKNCISFVDKNKFFDSLFSRSYLSTHVLCQPQIPKTLQRSSLNLTIVNAIVTMINIIVFRFLGTILILKTDSFRLSHWLSQINSARSGVADFNYFLLYESIDLLTKILTLDILTKIFSTPYTTFRRH